MGQEFGTHRLDAMAVRPLATPAGRARQGRRQLHQGTGRHAREVLV